MIPGPQGPIGPQGPPGAAEGSYSTWSNQWIVAGTADIALIDEVGGAIILTDGTGTHVRSLLTGLDMGGLTFTSLQGTTRIASARGIYTVVRKGGGADSHIFVILKNGVILFTSPALSYPIGTLSMSFSGKYIFLANDGGQLQLWVGV